MAAPAPTAKPTAAVAATGPPTTTPMVAPGIASAAAGPAAAAAAAAAQASSFELPTKLYSNPLLEFSANTALGAIAGFAIGAREGFRGLPPALRTASWQRDLAKPANAVQRLTLVEKAVKGAGTVGGFVALYTGVDLGLAQLRGGSRDLLNATLAGMGTGMAYGVYRGGGAAGISAGFASGLVLTFAGSALSLMRARFEVYLSPELRKQAEERAAKLAAEQQQKEAEAKEKFRKRAEARGPGLLSFLEKKKPPPATPAPTPTATAGTGTPATAAAVTTATPTNATQATSTAATSK